MPCPPSSPASRSRSAFVFGAVAHRVNFCTMGAITDVVNFGDWRRMRMWLLAIAVAIAGAAVLQAAGLVDLAKSIYTGAKVAWLSHDRRRLPVRLRHDARSGCGSKTLIRVGAGNLKSLIVLVFLGISAYMTLKGVFAVWRANGARPGRASTFGAATSDLPTLLARCGRAGAKAWLPFVVAVAHGRVGASRTAISARRAR